ncbi:hypothetical protein IAT38_006984 [Cryptococcus sp. DSM 104549]
MDQHVLECLHATLSPEESVRKHAEEQLAQLFLQPEGGLSLARLLLSQEVALPQRQMSRCLIGEQYINRHWSGASNAYEPPLTPTEVKVQIRPIILTGLSDPQRKIRLSSAHALSTVAKFDWPDDYPDLLSQLVQLITGGSPASVHGAMRIISDFVRNDLDEAQLLPVVQDLLPAVLGVLGNPEAHSPSTRASTVHVFRQVVRMLEIVKEEHPAAVKSAIDSIGNVWFGAFQQLLAADAGAEVQQNWENLSIRVEIFLTFSVLLNTFPRAISSYLVDYVRLSVSTLQSLLPAFTAFYITTGDDAPEPPSPTSDAGMMDPKIGIPDLGSAIFDFLTSAVRHKVAAPALVSGEGDAARGTELLEAMVGVVLQFTQVTRENEEEWMEDVNAFAMDEDDETGQYGVRTAGHDLVGSLIDKWGTGVAEILQRAVQAKIAESASAKQTGNQDWWKPLESVLALLGGIADDVRNVLEGDATAHRPPSFDVKFLFDHVIPDLLGQSDTPFLQGRAFVFASQYASSLSNEIAAQYLSAAVSVLGAAEVSVPVKISVVKTIKNFCRHVDAELMQPQSGKILGLLLPLLPHTSTETLYLLLETVHALVALDKNLLDEKSTPEVVERIYEVWLRSTSDPVVTAIVEEIYESLTILPNKGVVLTLVHTLAPKLAALISTPVTDETVHIPGEAVQLANSLIRTRGGPLEAELVATVTRSVMDLLRTTDDMDVIQHGMIHLTLIVRKDCEKLTQWYDAEGNNGIASIFGLLGRFLAPTFSESGGIFVGELIMHLFRKAGGAMAPVLPDLLRAVVARIASAQMTSFIQTLVLPFAYLFGTEHTISTLDLLSSFTVPTSAGTEVPALDLVLRAWCDTCDTITGSWNIRVSDMGMSKLFAMGDKRLEGVVVKGDLVISEVNRNTIMTRSRTRTNPNQFTQIPFPLKALKLILKDVSSEPTAGGKGKTDLEIDEDDGDDEWDDDDALGTGTADEFQFLSSWLETGAHDSDAQDDDEDLKSDPLAQIDIGQHLTQVLRHGYSANDNGMHALIEGLTDEEKGILRGVLTM